MTIAIACDFGGSHASLAIVKDCSLLAVSELSLDARDGIECLLPLIEEQIHKLLGACSLKTTDCLGFSLTLPSLVDFKNARIAGANDKFPDAASVDLHSWCRDKFGVRLVIENDARAALIGEHACGAGAAYSDILLLTLGTGIGSAVLIGGRPYRTRHLQGGNLGGHIPVSIHGRQCTCGAIGCMEAEASSWSLPSIVSSWPGLSASTLAAVTNVNFKVLFEHASLEDELSAQVLEHCIHVWSVGTVGLIHVYGPELVIFGGGVMGQHGRILPQISEYVQKHAWTPSGPVTIVPAMLGNHAALYGAVPLLSEFLNENKHDDL